MSKGVCACTCVFGCVGVGVCVCMGVWMGVWVCVCVSVFMWVDGGWAAGGERLCSQCMENGGFVSFANALKKSCCVNVNGKSWLCKINK